MAEMTEQERIAVLESEIRRLEDEERAASLEEMQSEAEISQIERDILEARRRGASEQEIEQLEKRKKQAQSRRDSARSRKSSARSRRSALEKQLESLVTRAFQPSRPVERAKPTPVYKPPSPAYEVEKEMPPGITLGQIGRTVATAGAGAVITAIFITSLEGYSKYVGALMGASIGTIFLATSPAGSIPSDLGIGMLAGASGWVMLKWTGKVS